MSGLLSSWMETESNERAVSADPKITPPADIGIYETPWVGGTRVTEFLGPVAATGFVSYRTGQSSQLRAVTAWRPIVQAKASALGANVVIGFDLSFDPFATYRGRIGVRWTATGTAAHIEPLF